MVSATMHDLYKIWGPEWHKLDDSCAKCDSYCQELISTKGAWAPVIAICNKYCIGNNIVKANACNNCIAGIGSGDIGDSLKYYPTLLWCAFVAFQ